MGSLLGMIDGRKQSMWPDARPPLGPLGPPIRPVFLKARH